jgi:3-methyladenine DNA glycosylase/8-oxoguanine DNA glycosylase
MARRHPLTSPLDLRATAGSLRHGAGDPTIDVGRDRVWRATRTPDGPATTLLALDGDELVVDAWGPGAAWAIEHGPALAGLTDDLAGFDPSPHPVVADLARRAPGLRMPRTDRVVEALVPAIIGQKVTGHEARRAWRGLVLSHGDAAPSAEGMPTGLRLPPAPDALLEIGYAGFHRFGVERRRAETVLRACREADRLEATLAHGSGALSARLQAIPGIGPWTAAVTIRQALGDPDAVPIGDYGIPSLVAWALAGERTADDDRMLELLAPFVGHRGRVIRLIKTGADKPERRGPRRAAQPWARW